MHDNDYGPEISLCVYRDATKAKRPAKLILVRPEIDKCPEEKGFQKTLRLDRRLKQVTDLCDSSRKNAEKLGGGTVCENGPGIKII